MSTLKLNTSNLSSSSPQNNLRGFKGTTKKNSSDSPIVSNFVFQDNQVNASKRLENSMNKLFYLALPIVDTGFKTLAEKGSLSARLKFAAKNAGIWGAAVLSVLMLNSAKKIVNSKVEALDKFDKKHGLMSTAIDVSGFVVVASFLSNSFNKLSSVFKKKYSNTIKNISKSLDSTVVNKRFISRFDKHVNKNFYNARALSLTSKLIAPVMALSAIAGIVSAHSANSSKNIKIVVSNSSLDSNKIK